MKNLKELGALAKAKIGGRLTFTIADTQTKVAAGTGNVGYRTTLSDGQVVNFWESTMDRVIEEVDENTFQLKIGTRIANDGGLIPADAEGGFWKD